MDNEKARKILIEAVDGEASKMEREEFESHLSQNAALKARYDFEKRFRNFVSGDEANHEAMPAHVRNSILEKLDEIASFGVPFTPALVIDGKVKSAGKLPKPKQIAKWLEEAASA